MTRKLAVFVEGLTEQEFVIKLITELAGTRDIAFEVALQKNGHLSIVEMRCNENSTPELHILVANCSCDNQVKSQIRDQYQRLKAADYSMIIGLRDVYPFSASEIPQLKENLNTGLPNDSIPIHLHLAIMEIEAWFLEELSHFPRIDARLNINHLISNGFDPNSTRAYQLPNPAKTLDDIYKETDKRYNKNKRQIQRTVDALCYEELYMNVRQNSASLDTFISSLETGMFGNIPDTPATLETATE